MRVYLFWLEFQNQNIYKFYLNILFVKENMYIRFASYSRNVSNNKPFEEFVSEISSV
jgi:transcriptional regulator NrdR family protein